MSIHTREVGGGYSRRQFQPVEVCFHNADADQAQGVAGRRRVDLQFGEQSGEVQVALAAEDRTSLEQVTTLERQLAVDRLVGNLGVANELDFRNANERTDRDGNADRASVRSLGILRSIDVQLSRVLAPC